MSGSQLQNSSVGSSLGDYDRFFDAASSFDSQQPAHFHRLPLGEEGYDAPQPYDREAPEVDFAEHHSAAYYPHAHQTLKSTENRRKKKKEVKYKKSKVQRPSQLFQPSLQEVAEQLSTTSTSSSEHGLWFTSARRSPELEHVISETDEEQLTARTDEAVKPVARVDSSVQTEGSMGGSKEMKAKFTVGSEDSMDGIVLVVPQSESQPSLGGIPSIEDMAPTTPSIRSGSGSLTNVPSADSQPIKFVLGGEGSDASILEDSNSAAVDAQNVTFILGDGSTDSFDVNKGGTTPHPHAYGRSHSEDPESTNVPPQMKVRSHSYHQGEGLTVKRCRGSDVELSDLPAIMMSKITSPEEAAVLNKHDLEDLATHRFEKLGGYGKHKINKKSMAKLSAAGADAQTVRPVVDVTPHELFVELDELVTQQHDETTTDLMEWKEKARWIKFEEDVLETSDRWGRPHVASLSFHSLIELRHLLENGAVLVDVDVHDYMSMMQTVVDQLVVRRLLAEHQKNYVMQALILRHSHLDGKAKVARTKSYGNLMGLDSLSRHSRNSHFFGANKNANVVSNKEEVDNPLIRRNSRSYGANLDRERYNMELLKKIPQDAEVASVLVGMLKDLEKPCTALFRLSQGVMLDHVAEVPLPIRFLFVCVGPNIESVEYLEIGRSLATLMSNKSFRDAAYAAKEKESILTAMNAFLDESMVLPPGDFDRRTLLPIMHMAKKSLKAKREKLKAAAGGSSALDGDEFSPEDDPLGRTKRPFGGLIKDIRRKAPYYLSDIKDGLNIQVFSAFIFIYFACLSPAITFGGLLGEKTHNYMGASEMLMATAVSGIIFALLGGQPLLITGFTGPNMVFEEGVFKFSKSFDIDFLTWRLWIGVWVFLIAVVLVATEASFLVKYVSRFTQEIFALLISLIFLWEVLYKLIKVFKEHPLCQSADGCPGPSSLSYDMFTSSHMSNISTTQAAIIKYSLPGNLTTTAMLPSNWANDSTTAIPPPTCTKPNTALLTMTFTLFTFVLAYALKGLRNKKVLGRTIRRALGDFGVPLAILLMCVIDYVIGDRVFTQKLQVPSKFSVTDPSKRGGWFINPLGSKEKPFPAAHIFSAALPAMLASILIYMETLIAGMIVDKKENKLKKGGAFHLDILIMGFAAIINGFLGVPFVCAATVRTVAHTSALTVMSRNHAPGERAKLERVLEQRVSNVLVHILIGVSLFLGVVLQYIPTAVLFGVFLYMGVASLSGIQLFDRMILLLTPTKHHPVDVGYVRHVRARKMNIFTIIQVLCVAVLWAVKLSPAALAFPFVLIMLVPLCQFVLPRFFSKEDLSELDSDDDCRVLQNANDDDLDFYGTAHMPD